MPAGRPSKRPGGDGSTSTSDSPSGTGKQKSARVGRGRGDFSSVVKNKLSSYSRTGQACDRCKVRKIRCDALPNGCTNCTQLNLECYVTDRVTGRTERRGYLQQLEREKTGMLNRIRDLEKLLEDKGVQVRPWQPSSAHVPATPVDPLEMEPAPGSPWAQPGSPWTGDGKGQAQPSNSRRSSHHISLPLHGTGASTSATPIGGHLGVARDSAPLSSIDGTQLSILGTRIDITSFDSPDMDGPPAGMSKAAPLYNKSLQSFYNSIAKVNPPRDAPLPSRYDAFRFSEFFFMTTGPFVPVLHKPTYMKLLSRIYDEPNFTPTKAELVIIHMVLAMMYWQFACRNGEDPERRAELNSLSNIHYHWSVDKTWNLAGEMTLTSAQGLVLMATHCRSFPKPGPAYIIASLAWNRVIECNMHRAYLGGDEPTTFENEMRKRIFWSLFAVVVSLFGRLGKPMPIRAEDIDVDYPIAIPDECLTDEGITDPGRIGESDWMVALAGFKLSFLFMDMWNSVYSARQNPDRYAQELRRVQQDFWAYQRDLPDQLRPGRRATEVPVHAKYLESACYEFLLCLRHPSHCATGDPAIIAENYEVCEDVSRKLLRTASELAMHKALDTTWYQMAVYVAAIFTLLASQWNRRTETTAAELADLKEHMNTGLSVVRAILKYIGASDAQVLVQITSVIDRTVASIEQEMRPRQSSSVPMHTHQGPHSGASEHDDYSPVSTHRREHAVSRSTSTTPGPVSSSSHATDQMAMPQRLGSIHAAAAAAAATTSYYSSPLTQINTNYSQMGYPELGTPTTGAGTSYTPLTDDSSHHHHSPYHYTTSAAAAAAAAAAAQTQHDHMISYGGQTQPAAPSHEQQHQQQHHPHHIDDGGHWMGGVPGVPGGGNSWSEWTHTMGVPSIQDRYSASALLSLGGAAQRGPDGTGTGAGAGEMADVPLGQWPIVVFDPRSVSGP